jgi:hypothetical protein
MLLLRLTVEKSCRKVDACVAIPNSCPIFDHAWDFQNLIVLEFGQHAILSPEAHGDSRNSQEKGLRPELEKFALKLEHISIGLDYFCRLELDPRDGAILRIGNLRIVWLLGSDCDTVNLHTRYGMAMR